jgi:hypothetical protein
MFRKSLPGSLKPFEFVMVATATAKPRLWSLIMLRVRASAIPCIGGNEKRLKKEKAKSNKTEVFMLDFCFAEGKTKDEVSAVGNAESNSISSRMEATIVTNNKAEQTSLP